MGALEDLRGAVRAVLHNNGCNENRRRPGPACGVCTICRLHDALAKADACVSTNLVKTVTVVLERDNGDRETYVLSERLTPQGDK